MPGPSAVQATVSTTSVTGLPNTSTGSSRVRVVIVTLQPGLGWTRREPSGESSGTATSSLVVLASSRSLGTVKVKDPDPPGATSPSTDTWADAGAAASTSAPIAAPAATAVPTRRDTALIACSSARRHLAWLQDE